MEQNPETVSPLKRLGRFMRKNALLFIALLIAVLWPKAQFGLERVMLIAFDGDPQAAAAYSAWLPMGNPLSKLAVAVAVFATGYIVVWFALKRTQPALAEWARDCFKHHFHELETKWKFVIFAAFWLVPLLYFAWCWQAAANLV